jgi:aspartate aminotransferase
MTAPRDRLADRLKAVGASPTLQVMMEAKAARARGVDVIDFGPGEPDFNTPENIKKAGTAAIAADCSHYTETSGIPELRQAISEHYHQQYGADWAPDEIITGCGGKNVLFLISMALFEPGDRVGIFAPYWVSFPEQVRLAGAEPVIIPTREEDGFIPRARDLEPHAETLRAVILNSPSNPSGATIPPDEVARLAEFARATGAILISDETYDAFHYGDGPYASFAAHEKSLHDRLLLVNSFSKTYAMTGWRVGYTLGPKSLIDAIKKIQSHDATHTAAISQAAAVEAMRGTQETVRAMRDEYRRRRDELIPALNRIRGVRCLQPTGAFYSFPNVEGAMQALDCPSSVEFAKSLMSEIAVATVPGEAFGVPGYLRLSYALSIERIRAGLDRLRGLLGEANG